MAKKHVEKKAATTKKKKKGNMKKLLSAPQAIAMKAKPAKENPFETIWNRRKFDIVGKKRKGEERLISSARSKGVEQRKKTLLKEYKQSGKSSAFLDKRIGERDDALGEFDKSILRFQREQQLKWKKKSKYNLSDGEEDDFEIPGGGSLSKLDDFDDEMLQDDIVDATENNSDNDKRDKSSTFLQDMHVTLEMGMSEGNENKHKTKKEVMEEIISKSKFYKAQKAKDKEENDELMKELDENFASLAQSDAMLSLIRPTKMNALKALLNKNNSKESLKEGFIDSAGEESSKQDQPDAYDKLVKEMVLDMRARPSGRTKTEEEIAQEERERLELLEEERRKRMLASDDSGGEESDGDEHFEVSQKKLRSVSGDDLGDSFCLDEEPTKKGWVDEILERKEDDTLENGNGKSPENSESDEDDSDSTDMEVWEQSDDDNLDTDQEVEDTLEEEEKELGKVLEKNVASIKDQNKDSPNTHKINADIESSLIREPLPFIIEAPSSLEELCRLLDYRSDGEVIEAVNRIRSCNAISLAAENRKKMQVFYGVLLQYFAVLANKKPLNFNLINLLVKPLMEISSNTPIYAAICARERILRIRNQLCDDIKNQEKSSWPSLKTLLQLRLWSMIFPCSDFRHPVMTPALLLMNEYLMRCPITSARDIAIGSFLCSMILSVTKQSHKFCPEAINFLKTLLMLASDNKSQLHQGSQCYIVMELTASTPRLHLSDHVTDFRPLDFLMVMDMPAESPFFCSDNFRAGVLSSVTETLSGFVSIYEGFSSFPEIFLPICTLLYEVVKQEYMPGLLRGNMTDLAQLIKKKANELQILRLPLQMRKKNPVPIKQFNPKFEENFVKGRDYDPDRQRAETKKIKRQLKQEARGAVRNLRKDNYFLSEVKEQEKLLAEEERAEKYGKARAFLQEQEHAFKSGQLGKGRKRRR